MDIKISSYRSNHDKLNFTYRTAWLWITIAAVYHLTMAQTHGWAVRFIENGLYTDIFLPLLVLLPFLSIGNGIHSLTYLKFISVFDNLRKSIVIYLIVLLMVSVLSVGITQTQFTRFHSGPIGGWVILQAHHCSFHFY